MQRVSAAICIVRRVLVRHPVRAGEGPLLRRRIKRWHAAGTQWKREAVAVELLAQMGSERCGLILAQVKAQDVRTCRNQIGFNNQARHQRVVRPL